MKKNQSGFTLIELLVVISIIGLLSTMAVVSLNSSRSKARDAKRVSDIKKLSSLIELDKTSLGDLVAIAGCDGAYDLTTLCSGGDYTVQAPSFVDPSNSVTPCDNSSVAPCAYSISTEGGLSDASYGDYQICAYLESGSGGLSQGRVSVKTGGLMDSVCN